jgi:hypothetical protein
MDLKGLVGSLRQAADELERISGAVETITGMSSGRSKGRKGKRVLSAEARAKISAAAKKRWAKTKSQK